MIIGLTGGIASGKSHVAATFERHGCAVFDADQAAKACLLDDDVVSYLESIGFPQPLDKQALGKFLFTNHRARAGIERIVHPKVHQAMLDFLAAQQLASADRHIILDIPLLFEKGLQDFCDLIIYVYSPYNIREGRAILRGWSIADFNAREKCQFSVEQKERMSDMVIPSYGDYGDLVDLDAVVRQILESP